LRESSIELSEEDFPVKPPKKAPKASGKPPKAPVSKAKQKLKSQKQSIIKNFNESDEDEHMKSENTANNMVAKKKPTSSDSDKFALSQSGSELELSSFLPAASIEFSEVLTDSSDGGKLNKSKGKLSKKQKKKPVKEKEESDWDDDGEESEDADDVETDDLGFGESESLNLMEDSADIPKKQAKSLKKHAESAAKKSGDDSDGLFPSPANKRKKTAAKDTSDDNDDDDLFGDSVSKTREKAEKKRNTAARAKTSSDEDDDDLAEESAASPAERKRQTKQKGGNKNDQGDFGGSAEDVKEDAGDESNWDEDDEVEDKDGSDSSDGEKKVADKQSDDETKEDEVESSAVSQSLPKHEEGEDQTIPAKEIEKKGQAAETSDWDEDDKEEGEGDRSINSASQPEDIGADKSTEKKQNDSTGEDEDENKLDSLIADSSAIVSKALQASEESTKELEQISSSVTHTKQTIEESMDSKVALQQLQLLQKKHLQELALLQKEHEKGLKATKARLSKQRENEVEELNDNHKADIKKLELSVRSLKKQLADSEKVRKAALEKHKDTVKQLNKKHREETEKKAKKSRKLQLDLEVAEDHKQQSIAQIKAADKNAKAADHKAEAFREKLAVMQSEKNNEIARLIAESEHQAASWSKKEKNYKNEIAEFEERLDGAVKRAVEERETELELTSSALLHKTQTSMANELAATQSSERLAVSQRKEMSKRVVLMERKVDEVTAEFAGLREKLRQTQQERDSLAVEKMADTSRLQLRLDEAKRELELVQQEKETALLTAKQVNLQLNEKLEQALFDKDSLASSLDAEKRQRDEQQVELTQMRALSNSELEKHSFERSLRLARQQEEDKLKSKETERKIAFYSSQEKKHRDRIVALQEEVAELKRKLELQTSHAQRLEFQVTQRTQKVKFLTSAVDGAERAAAIQERKLREEVSKDRTEVQRLRQQIQDMEKRFLEASRVVAREAMRERELKRSWEDRQFEMSRNGAALALSLKNNMHTFTSEESTAAKSRLPEHSSLYFGSKKPIAQVPISIAPPSPSTVNSLQASRDKLNAIESSAKATLDASQKRMAELSTPQQYDNSHDAFYSRCAASNASKKPDGTYIHGSTTTPDYLELTHSLKFNSFMR